MPFTTRNPFYLRISNSTVLPTYVSGVLVHQSFYSVKHCQIYLDDRHVQWMSDTVLQFVLSDLRPQSVHDYLSTYIATLRRNSLLSKLKAEADIVLGGNAWKKTTVDNHRGGDPVFFERMSHVSQNV